MSLTPMPPFPTDVEIATHIVDVHAHPTDSLIPHALLDDPGHTICAMSTRRNDQARVAALARAHPKRVVPGFGYHPWFTHLIYVPEGVDPAHLGERAGLVQDPTPKKEEKPPKWVKLAGKKVLMGAEASDAGDPGATSTDPDATRDDPTTDPTFLPTTSTPPTSSPNPTPPTYPPPDKSTHYRALFNPKPHQEAIFQDLLARLPDPVCLTDLLDELRRNIKAFPGAILGEVGLDRAFRVPMAGKYAGEGEGGDDPTTTTSTDKDGASTKHSDATKSTSPTPTPTPTTPTLSPFTVPITHQLAILEAQVALAITLRAMGESVHARRDIVRTIWMGMCGRGEVGEEGMEEGEEESGEVGEGEGMEGNDAAPTKQSSVEPDEDASAAEDAADKDVEMSGEKEGSGGDPSTSTSTTPSAAALPFTLPRALRRIIPPALLLGDEDDPFRRRTVLNGTPPLPAVMGISLHAVKAPKHTVDFMARMKERYGDRWRAISVDLHSCGLSAEVWRSVEAAHPNAFLSLSTGINMRQPHGTAPSSDPNAPPADPSLPPPIPKSLTTLILSAHPSRLLAESDWHNAGESGQKTWEMLNIIARVKGWDVEGVSGRGARNVVKQENVKAMKAGKGKDAKVQKGKDAKGKAEEEAEEEAKEEKEEKETKEATEAKEEKETKEANDRSTSRGRKRSAEEAAEGDDDVSSPAPSKRSRSSPTPPPGTEAEGGATSGEEGASASDDDKSSSSPSDSDAGTKADDKASTSSEASASRGRKRSAEVAAEGEGDSAPTASRPSPPKRSRSSPTPEADEAATVAASSTASSSSSTLAASSTSTTVVASSSSPPQTTLLPKTKKTRPPGNPYAAGAHRIADPHRQGRVPQDTHEVPRAVQGPAGVMVNVGSGALHAPSLSSFPPGTTPLTGLATVPHVPSASTPGYAAPNIHVVRKLHENWVRFKKGNHGVPPPVSRKQRRMARHARYDEWEEEERARGEDD